MICSHCKTKIENESAQYCFCCGKRLGTPEPRAKAKKKRGNGQGTVIKRGKTYTALITVGSYYDANTDKVVRKRVSKGGFATKTEALMYIPQLWETAYGAQPTDLALYELYQLWLPEHSGKVRSSTMDCYKAAWAFYKDIWSYPVSKIKTPTLQACIDQCPRGKRTKENMRALATQLYKYALSHDLAAKNYAAYLNADGETQAPREAFTADELRRMWDAVTEDPGSSVGLALILCYTGMRLGELLSLTGDSYHEEVREDGETVRWFTGGSKTKAGRNRQIPVSPLLVPLLERWGLRWKKGEYLFTVNGNKMQPKYFRTKLYYPALSATGVRRLVPHCCRHTYATLLKSVDVSDADKMKSIGHAQLSVTMHYTHSDTEGIRKIENQIGAGLCKQPGKQRETGRDGGIRG